VYHELRAQEDKILVEGTKIDFYTKKFAHVDASTSSFMLLLKYFEAKGYQRCNNYLFLEGAREADRRRL
jgi:hypothetical protein